MSRKLTYNLSDVLAIVLVDTYRSRRIPHSFMRTRQDGTLRYTAGSFWSHMSFVIAADLHYVIPRAYQGSNLKKVTGARFRLKRVMD